MNGRDAFLDALVAAALEPTTPIDFPDGNLVRYRVRGDKPGSRNGWAVYHAQPLPAGAFGSWRTGESHTWRDAVAMSRLTPVQRQQAAVSQRDRERLRAEAEVSVRALARNRAARLWAPARPATDMHPYLQAKRVPAYGIRQLRDMLVIPARDAAGELHTLQFISADGAKRFLSGGRISGCYYAIAGSGDGLLICEGYATGATIRLATGAAVAVAFNAGNLVPVAQALRAKFPRLRLVIAADNDRATPGNPGLREAIRAARAVGGRVAVPSFPEAANG
ncbi:MAG: toprim domain-containing protein [Zoogloeaceae bacterium]|nr:toprim domain-containing protein [Zoogloeaceae bacterium]